MKKHIIIALGVLAWVIAGADLATNLYVNHQKVLALQNTTQTQLVNKQEQSLQTKLSAALGQVNQYKQQVSLQSAADKAALCTYVSQAQPVLVKYHVTVPTPSNCQ